MNLLKRITSFSAIEFLRRLENIFGGTILKMLSQIKNLYKNAK